jgi:ubiquinone/menaquinone biosynthesis C-methylase UbiE
MRARLYNLYDLLQRRLAPGLQNSQYSYKQALQTHSPQGGTWLDLGCGHQLLPDWMPSSQQDEAYLLEKPQLFVGIDAHAPSLQKNNVARNLVVGNVEILPFRSEAFDLVTANMVVEHVRQPAELLGEVRRVLKPGGEFLFHTPNLWGYTTLTARLLPQRLKVWLVYFLQGRKEADIFPAFYRLNSPATVKTLARESGLEVSEISLLESSAQTAMLGPLVILELLLIRALRWDSLSGLRTNLIVVLRKPGKQTNA